MIGRSLARATVAEMRQRPARRGLVDHRRQYHEAVDPDLLGVDGIAAGQRRGVLATLARTGTRPFTVSTASLRTWRFSSASSEQFSPTVPSTMKPCMPARRSRFDMRCRGREIDGLVRLEVSGDRRVHTLPLRHGLPFFDLVLRPAERCHSRPGQSI